MSEMSPSESMERVKEGLKKASSLMRDLARKQKNPKWAQSAKALEGILHSAEVIYNSKGQTRQEALNMADAINKRAADKQEKETKH